VVKIKGIVIYRSKSGFTRKYAVIIAESLKYDLVEQREINMNRLREFDNIIYGAGLYAIGINGLSFITKKLTQLQGKNIAVFACGATPARKEDIENIKSSNFRHGELEKINFFYMRGGFDYKKLTLVDKFLMSLLKIKLKAKKDLKGDALGMLNAYSHPLDFTSEKNALPIIDHFRELEAANA